MNMTGYRIDTAKKVIHLMGGPMVDVLITTIPFDELARLNGVVAHVVKKDEEAANNGSV